VFAADRTNPTVARRYDTLSPAVLNLVRTIMGTATDAGRSADVSVCGEMAGRPLEAMALIGLGVTSLSMQAAAIGPVKMMVRSVNTATLRTLVEGLHATTGKNAREALTRFAGEHGVEIARPA